MKKEMRQIREFYEMIGAESRFNCIPNADIPSSLKDVRQNLILEEVAELFKAMNDKDLVEIFDALLDIQYVVLGTALTYGLEHRMLAGWNEVHRTNMAKAGPNGKAITRPDGKVIKPEGWQPPNLKLVLSQNLFVELDAHATRLEAMAASIADGYNRADRQTRNEQLQVEAAEQNARNARKKANRYKEEE